MEKDIKGTASKRKNGNKYKSKPIESKTTKRIKMSEGKKEKEITDKEEEKKEKGEKTSTKKAKELENHEDFINSPPSKSCSFELK